MKVSIVMATHNRRQLLINSLKVIEYYNAERDIEVIVVDDNSDQCEAITDIPDLFKIPVIIIPISEEDKNWMCCCMPFNIGFSIARGDIIIIQNPENLHVGDIVGHAIENLKDGTFFSYALYSLNQQDTDHMLKRTVKKEVYTAGAIKKAIGVFATLKADWKDGDTCWYNHSQYRPCGGHLISAITRSDLEDLHGFDERYGKGFAYDDYEFTARLKRKGMDIQIIDQPFALHQRHALAKYRENRFEFERNGNLYSNVTLREKLYRSPKNYFYCPRDEKISDPSALIVECPITGDTDFVEFLNLGHVPLVNNLCDTAGESLEAKRYPLAIGIFPKSRLTCLSHVIDPDILFENYVYKSGINKPFLDHAAEMYDYINNLIILQSGDVIVDVGGNDGSLLYEFRKRGDKTFLYDFINVDASKSFIEDNKSKGIEYINAFFDENFRLKRKAAKVIISTNVFQHTLEIRSFARGVRNNLAPDGVWCLEFPYLLTTLWNDNYDQIYHEHIFYYILSNIVDLLAQEKMSVINVSFYDIHGGTLRVISARASAEFTPDSTVGSFLRLEKSLTVDYCKKWGKRAIAKIWEFKQFFKSLKESGKDPVIVGFGAAAKGCVFLTSIGIDNTTVSYIIDDTPYKQGKFVPGTGIQIVSREILKKIKVDYILILAHNFRDYIMESLKDEYSGKFIIMFPEIKIL